MALNTPQKLGMVDRALHLGRELGDWNKKWNSFKEEYDAEDAGNTTTGVTTAILDAYAPTKDLTNAQFTSFVAAADTVSTSVETNKTSLYQFAAADSTP